MMEVIVYPVIRRLLRVRTSPYQYSHLYDTSSNLFLIISALNSILKLEIAAVRISSMVFQKQHYLS